jgi:polysaccharide deacetylase family protein (PEP-CTERM system associated)
MTHRPSIDAGLIQEPTTPLQPGQVARGPVPRSRLPSSGSDRTHVLTIALEDYFHVTPLQTVIREDRWYRFEMRLEASTRRTLDLLEECGARATFFVLGWVADAAPELVREVAERGHEVASKGYHHRPLRGRSRDEFREDAVRAREALERATGQRVLGYRLAEEWLRPKDAWALEVLAESGYQYDSSVRLMFRTYAGEPWRQFPYRTIVAGRPFLEVPLSSVRLLGFHVPIAGGNYFRQFPSTMVQHAVAHWDRHCPSPYVMYFHTWELDPDQPRINGVPLSQQVRQYRNLRKMPALLRHYLESYRFTSIAQYFALGEHSPAGAGAVDSIAAVRSASGRLVQVPVPPAAQTAVTVVVPCYNEEQSLPYLANTLRSVVDQWAKQYRFHFLLVDDCSTDRTWQMLQTIFKDQPRCTLVRHERNQGVAAAILTGIKAATTDIVCSMDCDCTYDPHDLGRMIPLLTEDVDLVTASPYHPQGSVRNVPPWRLFLSKNLSRLYRIVFSQKLYTYTSCFRVYRREALAGISVERGGFLGVTEMLGRLDLSGRRIVEFPAMLEARMLGRSKMKVVRTIGGHLRLLIQLIRLRLRAPRLTARTARPAAGE